MFDDDEELSRFVTICVLYMCSVSVVEKFRNFLKNGGVVTN